jgi:ATP-dependent protease ClpP protease subunit
MKNDLWRNLAAGGATLIAVTVGSGAFLPAHALDYSFRMVSPHVAVVDASGIFVNDEPDEFNAWMNHLSFILYLPDEANPPANGIKLGAVIFNSRGGSVLGGMAWADYIEQHQINTGVAAGGRCASICVAAWAAGAKKTATPDTSIGVHAASYSGTAALTDGGLLEAKATTLVAQWLANHGAPQSIVDATVYTPPTDIHWATADELTAWNTKITW